MTELLLIDNPYIVTVIMLFMIFDILAFHPSGVIARQVVYLTTSGHDRTFEDNGDAFLPMTKPLLIVQTFLFTGLILFCASFNRASVFLDQPTFESVSLLALCIAVPTAWFFLHWMLINWFCFLFNSKLGMATINNVYTAVYTLAAPLALLLFLLYCLDYLSLSTITVLLCIVLALTQIVFLGLSFKVFMRGIGTTVVILMYILAFEVAPIWILAKCLIN